MAGLKQNIQRLTAEVVSDKAQRRAERLERLQQQREAREERDAARIAKEEARAELANRFEKLSPPGLGYTLQVKKRILQGIAKEFGTLTAVEAERVYYKELNKYVKAVKLDEENQPPSLEGVEELKKQVKILKIKNIISFLYELFKKILILPLILLYILWKVIGSGRKLYK